MVWKNTASAIYIRKPTSTLIWFVDPACLYVALGTVRESVLGQIYAKWCFRSHISSRTIACPSYMYDQNSVQRFNVCLIILACCCTFQQLQLKPSASVQTKDAETSNHVHLLMKCWTALWEDKKKKKKKQNFLNIISYAGLEASYLIFLSGHTHKLFSKFVFSLMDNETAWVFFPKYVRCNLDVIVSGILV